MMLRLYSTGHGCSMQQRPQTCQSHRATHAQIHDSSIEHIVMDQCTYAMPATRAGIDTSHQPINRPCWVVWAVGLTKESQEMVTESVMA